MANYGGQAVIEGVMIRGRETYAIAVRRPDQEIYVHLDRVHSVTDRLRFLSWPFLRGVVVLVESMILGLKALNFSANQVLEGEEEELTAGEIAISVGVAFLLAIGLFVVLPALFIRSIQGWIEYNVLLNLIEGLIKMFFLLLYILVIARFEDIERFFQYHGAEHKVIHTYEHFRRLNLEEAKNFSPLHPRCGTSFILLVIMISVLLFSFFGRPPVLMRIGLHLILLPAVAGISYEMIKFTGRRKGLTVRMIALPGLMLQKFTTREPDEGQLEVALAALRGVLKAEGIKDFRVEVSD